MYQCRSFDRFLLLLACGTMFMASAEYAQATLIEEDFVYGANSELQGGTGGSGWAGNWSTDTSRVYIRSGSLAYASGGYDITQAGSSNKAGTGFTDIRGLRRATNTVGDTFWFSYLVENIATTGQTTQYVALQFNPTAGSTLASNYIQFIDGQMNVNYGSQLSSAVVSGLARNTTHLVLGKWQLGASADQLDLWINPTNLASLGTPNFSRNDLNAISAGLTHLGMIGLGTTSSASGAVVTLDALRLSDGAGNLDQAYFQVTGVAVPEPVSIALAAAGVLALPILLRRRVRPMLRGSANG